MAKRGVDALLKSLSSSANPSADEINRGLASGQWVVIEAAAKASKNVPAGDVAGGLAAVLQRLINGMADPNAAAAIAVIEAMRHHQLNERELFREAILYQRIEKGFGEGIDVGSAVRAGACFALVESGDPSAALMLAGVLFERPTSPNVADSPAARIAAARGLGAVGDRDASAVLRIKLLHSALDSTDVIGECLGSLVALADEQAMPTLEAALLRYPEAAADAVIPVAESQSPTALSALRLLRDSLRLSGEEELAMIGFALLRSAEGTDALFEALVDRPPTVAKAAAKALHLQRRDPAISERFDRIAAELPNERELREAFNHG